PRDAVTDRRERAGEPLSGAATGERSDEVLARSRKEDRAAERGELAEPSQQRNSLCRVLAHVRPRAQNDLVLAHAERAGQLDPLLLKPLDVLDHVPVAR